MLYSKSRGGALGCLLMLDRGWRHAESGEIRAVIDKLLAINGELQHVAKLKKLLP